MNLRSILFTAAALSATAFSQEQSDLKDVTGTFDVVIGRRGDPLAQPFAILGVMRAKLAKDGTFTGTLEPATFPDGRQLPAVVFRGSPLLPDAEAPKSIPVEGQYVGRNVSLIVKYGSDPGKWIYGIGFSTHDPFKQVPPNTPVVAAGATVGPEIGDQGDWQKLGQEVDVNGPRCRDIYVNGLYHCTICAPGTVIGG